MNSKFDNDFEFLDITKKKNLIESFLSLKDHLMKYVETHSMVYNDVMDKINASSVRFEYCNGSSLHGGYYCPSLILDVVGNVKRGKLVKNPKKSYKYKYFFNQIGQLIATEFYTNYNTLYVVQVYDYFDNDTIYATCIDDRNVITNISRIKHSNGNLVEYDLGSIVNSEILSIKSEYNQFDNKSRLIKSNYIQFFLERHVLGNYSFTFQYDENDNLLTYTTLLSKENNVCRDISAKNIKIKNSFYELIKCVYSCKK
jgi:hypothetical protein